MSTRITGKIEIDTHVEKISNDELKMLKKHLLTNINHIFMEMGLGKRDHPILKSRNYIPFTIELQKTKD